MGKIAAEGCKCGCMVTNKHTKVKTIDLFGVLRGTVKFHGNIIDPLDEAEWEVQK